MTRRARVSRTAEQVLADAGAMELLAAIRDGQVERDSSGGFWAPYLRAGELVPVQRLRALNRDGLIDMRMIGPPSLAPRGVGLLG